MARAGQITITTAGTAQRGPDVVGSVVSLTAHPSNTGAAWVGDDGAGDVSAANGYPLEVGAPIVMRVSNLSDLWFDVTTNGNKICWLLLE